jgi:2-polyprenyl-3-methyl-5-hydroxy-6-metoxy-1,4-benzoquinol methylase
MTPKLKKREWGKDPYFYGPRQYFRQTLLVNDIKKNKIVKKNRSMNARSKIKVLDAGCGNGSLSFRLAKEGMNITGIDITKDNIDFSNNVKNKLKIDNINFKKMSITNIKLPKNSFDIIISSEVLEHIEDDNKAVKELNKVLKKGGECIISVPYNPKLWSLEDKWVGHKRRYTYRKLRKLLVKNGFKVNNIKCMGFPLLRIYFALFRFFILKKKVKEGKVTKQSVLFQNINKLVSYVFFLDTLFDSKKLGIGLIVRAKKIKNI